MKKLLFLFSFTLYVLKVSSQSGGTCDSAIIINNLNSCVNNIVQSGTYMWFRFTADATSKMIELKKDPLSYGHIHAMGLLADNCNTITILDSAKIVPGNDSLLVINATSLIVGTSYIIVTERDKPTCPKCVNGNAEFNLCLSEVGYNCELATDFLIAGPSAIERYQTETSKWYKITADSTNEKFILIGNILNFNDRPNKLILWTGNCSSLIYVDSDTLSNNVDSVLEISAIGLSPTALYYLEVIKTNNIDAVHYEFGIKNFLPEPSCGTCPIVVVDSCNLICNGSFENYIGSPPSSAIVPGGGLNICGWENATDASPDYYRTNGIGYANIPNTGWGTYTARTGNAMVGFIANQPNISWHEYIYQKFRYPLVANATYNITFYVRPGTNYFADAIGAWVGNSTDIANIDFSGAGLLSYYSSLPVIPQIISTSIINNTTQWTQITGTYTATGGEEYIIIGNFGNTITTGPPSRISYYFLDDVSITPDPTLVINATPPVICLGQSSTLSVVSMGWPTTLFSYWWPGGSLSCATCTTTVATPTVTTTYLAVISHFPGCKTVEDTTVTVLPLPAITVNSATICAGQTATLTATGGVSYTWSNGATGSTITVSPSTTTTYTVTGVGSNGCTATATATVTISVPPITVNSPTICNGQTATLTASGGVSYVWSNGATTSNITVSPSTTTSYTVTGTNSFGCSNSAVATVTVSPSPVISVNSASICVGQTATLTATGASSYTWMPGGLTGSSITVSPASTINYTVTGTTVGCSATATAIVTVNPLPTVTATASPTPSFVGTPTTLIASGTLGVNYTWSPGGSTGNTLTVTPTATGTYTYTVTAVNPVTGCASSTTVTFTVQPSQCNLIFDYIIPSGATSNAIFGGTPSSTANVVNKNIYINGNFVVNNLILTFTGCNIVMAPSARITVLSDQNLQITQRTHVFSCVDMWDGIYVQFHGKLSIKGSSIIEDGISAVNIANGAYLCDFDAAVFNKNLTSINLTSNTAATSPVTITNSVFTSRTIPTFTNVVLNPTVLNVQSNINSGVYSFANINGYAAASIPVQRGGIGVNATNVNTLNVGSDVAPPTGSFTNLFDAIKCGIKLSNTNATIVNNNFQYHLNPSICTGCLNLAGYGIYASSTSATASYSLQVGGNTNVYQPNTFKNNFIAVYATNYRTNGIIKNTIDNISTGTPSPFGYGQAGMFIQPAQNNVVVLNENTITNCKEAIYVNLNTTTATSSIVAMQVNNNTITANATGFCTNGIYVTSLVAGSATVNAQVKDNVVTEAVNGIQLLNLKRTVNVQTNSCEVRYATTGNRNGIVAKGCQQLKIENNHTKYNNVGGLAYNLGGNLAAYGIYLQQSSNMLVKCNKIDDAARSMVFEGTCTSSPWLAGYGIFQNTMSRAQDGFVLLNNGVIGQQGAFTPPLFNYASNNYWDNTTTPTFTNSQTFTDNTFNANSTSRLFMNNTALTMPTNNQTSGTVGLHNYLSTGTSPGLNIATAVPPACGPVPTIAPPGGGGSVALNYGNELKTLLEDSVNLQFYIQETNWMRKQFVYYELMNNAPMAAFSGLNSFKTEMLTGNVGKLKRVEERIENGNYIAANAINNTVNPENIVEQNQKSMNTYIIKQLINAAYTYSAAETADVLAIANQCPLEGGQAVYQARNLAMDIKQQIIDFVDNCDKLPRREMQAIPATPEKENSLFKLYPNPNDGSMNLIYTMEASSQGQFILYDITGKTISTYVLQHGINNQLFINETILNNGVYFYKVIIDGIVKTSDKLVIIR